MGFKKYVSFGVILIVAVIMIQSSFAGSDYENMDFGEFTMDVSDEIDFSEDTLDEKHVFNSKQMVVGIYSKGEADVDYVYNFLLKDASEISPSGVSSSDFSGEMTFYKEKESNFLDDYAATYENDEYIILITYNDLGELVDMTRTIELS